MDMESFEQLGQGFNRTFMELKFSGQTINKTKEVVLIVPLWN